MTTITVQLSDGQGSVRSKEFHTPNTVDTLAEAQAVLDDIITIWPDVSGAGMSNPTVSLPLSMTPITAQPDSNLDEAARLRFAMSTGVGNENYRLPAPHKTAGVFTYIVGGAVDITYADLLAFVALFSPGESLRIGVNSLRAVSNLISGYLEKK